MIYIEKELDDLKKEVLEMCASSLSIDKRASPARFS